MADFNGVNLSKVRGITLGVLGGVYILFAVLIYRLLLMQSYGPSKDDQMVFMVWVLAFGVMWVAQWLVWAGRAMPPERCGTGVLVGLSIVFGLVDGFFGLWTAGLVGFLLGTWLPVDAGGWMISGGLLGMGFGVAYVLLTGRNLNRYVFTRNLMLLHLLFPVVVSGLMGMMALVPGIATSSGYEDYTLPIAFAFIVLAAMVMVVWGISPVVYLLVYRRAYGGYVRERDGGGGEGADGAGSMDKARLGQ